MIRRIVLGLALAALAAFPASAQFATQIVSGGVPSIAGTTNQINQSGSPGATTLSLSSTLVVPGTLQVTSTTSLLGAVTINTGGATVLTSPAVRTLHVGPADAAVATTQNIGFIGVVAGTTDIAGANDSIIGSIGTGTGNGGNLLFKVAPAASGTASTQNALVTAMTVHPIAGAAVGFIGIGVATPANLLDMRYDQNASTLVSLVNANAGASASMGYLINSGTSQTYYIKTGSSFTTVGMLRQDGGYIQEGGAGGFSLFTSVNQPIYFGVNSAQVAQFTSTLATFAMAPSFTGTAPTPTGTGSPTMASGSTDTSGEVTSGTSATSVIITFATAKSNAPFCTVTPQTQLLAFAYTISTTAITITQTATSGEKIDYFCAQH